jgi:hypothetical protein
VYRESERSYKRVACLNFNMLKNTSDTSSSMVNSRSGSRAPPLLGMNVGKIVICEVPGDISTAVLSRWITIETLAKLDTALCSSDARAQFLSLLRNPSFVADTMCTSNRMAREEYVQHYKWLMKRHVRVQNWIVYGDAAMVCSPRFTRNFAGSHVRSLHLCLLISEDIVKVFSTLATSCSDLHRLYIKDCEHWEAVSMLSASAQQSLEELIVAYCDGDCWMSYAQFPNLRKLHVRNTKGTDIIQSVTSLLIAAPNLTDLRLSSFSVCPVDNTSLQVLSSNAAGLKILELSVQRQAFTFAAVVSLAERCSNLKTLALMCGDGVNDLAVEAFALYCSQLEGLQLSGTFTAESLNVVSKFRDTTLRYLTLDMFHCAADGLGVIADRCRLLEEMQLSNCRFLADGSVIQLVSSLPRLRELLLVDSCAVTDDVLVAIATHLPKLATLSLHSCGGRYTEVGAVALATSLTQLQRFYISANDTSVFTPALREHWQDEAPGLLICDDGVVSTRYFESLSW